MDKAGICIAFQYVFYHVASYLHNRKKYTIFELRSLLTSIFLSHHKIFKKSLNGYVKIDVCTSYNLFNLTFHVLSK